MANLLVHFRMSILITIACLGAAWWWGQQSGLGGWEALTLAFFLGAMEISLSFDNAVVNASILREMDEKWRRLFLTAGILIAVFGMRLLFPIGIVAFATGDTMSAVTHMALHDPEEYAQHLTAHHATIAAFGGMFLLLVFLSFLLDEGKQLHWLHTIESYLARLGKLDAISIVIALAVLLGCQQWLPVSQDTQLEILVAGIAGVVLYLLVSSLDAFFENDDPVPGNLARRSGIMGFIYLEVLDASFSFDGVIGAFAITRDLVIILLGLTIGAMFVRSITVYLVVRGTLERFVYLEHGAHYGIGALAMIMLAGIVYHIPEMITGLAGISLIAAALVSSVIHNRRIARHSPDGPQA